MGMISCGGLYLFCLLFVCYNLYFILYCDIKLNYSEVGEKHLMSGSSGWKNSD